MATIKLYTRGQQLLASEKPVIASHGAKSAFVQVDFDSYWDGLGKSAVFINASDINTPYESPLADGKCEIPQEVLTVSGFLFIGLRGVKSDGTVIPSALIRYELKDGAPAGTGTIIPPTASEYQQLLGAYGTLQRAVEVERARINNLLSAETVDGELLDMRVGAGGETYDTAGEAVRAQSRATHGRLDDITTASRNLFDKRRATIGKFLEYTNTGNTYDIEGFFVSDYIPVKANTTYNLNNHGDGAAKLISQYTADKTHISSASAWNVTTAENAAFIRFSTAYENIDTTMFFEGIMPTEYIPYREMLNGEAFADNSVKGDIVRNGTIPPAKMRGYRVISKNLFNPHAITEGVYLYYENGDLKEFDGYFVSEYFAIKPNAVYSVSFAEQMAFYDENYKFIERRTAVNSTFTTPENAAFIRVSDDVAQLEKMQINEGAALVAYDSFAFVIDGDSNNGNSAAQPRICTLGKAWNEWANGAKFPIGILGDSTTDGANTTAWTSATSHEKADEAAGGFGKVDYICETAYPHLLEQLIRAELSNTVMRVYNLGYTGYSFQTLKDKYEAIFSGVYSDVKMVGISLGINDRIDSGKTENAYYTTLRENLIYTIEFLYRKGIQPFIITSQATVEPAPDTTVGNQPLRTSEAINSIANRAKKEVAEEYGLEIIDMTAFGEFMLTYSANKSRDIISDELHFNDLGHKLEAQFLFSQLCPRTVTATHGTRLSFASQKVKSACGSENILYLDTAANGFGVGMDYTKANTNDVLVQDFVIFNKAKNPLELIAYCTAAGTQYVVIDGEKVNITSTAQTIKALDVGVHTIKAYSGETNKVNWLGFAFRDTETLHKSDLAQALGYDENKPISQKAFTEALAEAGGEGITVFSKSAYDYAQDGGYTGTEEEFAQALARLGTLPNAEGASF